MIGVRIEVRRVVRDLGVVMTVVRIGRVERTQGAPMIAVRRVARDLGVAMTVVRTGRVERTQGAPMIEVRIAVRRVARDSGVAMTVVRIGRVGRVSGPPMIEVRRAAPALDVVTIVRRIGRARPSPRNPKPRSRGNLVPRRPWSGSSPKRDSPRGLLRGVGSMSAGSR
jgi:hypothetical protein